MGTRELIALLAFLSATTALSIDSILAAFVDLRKSFSLAQDSSAPALTLSFFFLGLASGQMVWGFAADRFGRKPTLHAGFALFALGSLGATIAPSMAVMLPFRFLWGVGAAAARAMSVTITRDLFDGDELSTVMSRVQAIFMIAPVFAPSLGAAMLVVLPWRSVFATGVFFAAIGAIWIRRLDETLRPEYRRPIELRSLRRGVAAVTGSPGSRNATLALTLHYAAFFPYLGSAELIFDHIYDRGAWFPYLFGFSGLAMGISGSMAARTIQRVGTESVLRRAAFGLVASSGTLLALALATNGRPAFWLAYFCLTITLMFHLPLSPMYNSLAMQPVGHVAGAAASVIGTVSLGVGTLIGTPVAGAITSRITALPAGFFIFGGIGVIFGLRAARATRLAQSPPS